MCHFLDNPSAMTMCVGPVRSRRFYISSCPTSSYSAKSASRRAARLVGGGTAAGVRAKPASTTIRRPTGRGPRRPTRRPSRPARARRRYSRRLPQFAETIRGECVAAEPLRHWRRALAGNIPPLDTTRHDQQAAWPSSIVIPAKPSRPSARSTPADSEQSEPFSESIMLDRQNQRAAVWTALQEG
jgi:hypothetical protein